MRVLMRTLYYRRRHGCTGLASQAAVLYTSAPFLLTETAEYFHDYRIFEA